MVKPKLNIDNHVIFIHGDILFDTILSLLEEIKVFLKEKNNWIIDLSHVGQVDSSALALFCQWQKEVPAIAYQNFPKQLRNMLPLWGLENIFSF